MTTNTISPLRRRMTEDMSARKLTAGICTYGNDAAIVARKRATMAVQAGDVDRAHDWEEIVSDVERRVCCDKAVDPVGQDGT